MIAILPLIGLLLGYPQAAQISPKPLYGVEGLAFLLGDWTSHESAKGPNGKETPFDLKGKNTWILEGQFLQMDESFEVPGQGKFANHILMGYDKGTKKYWAWWFTNHQAQPIAFSGDRTEKTLVLTQDTGRLRISYDLLEDGHYKVALLVQKDGDWAVQTAAEYRRQSK